MNITDIENTLDIARHCGSDEVRPMLCVDWRTGEMTVDTKLHGDTSYDMREYNGHEWSVMLPLVDATAIRDALEGCQPVVVLASAQY